MADETLETAIERGLQAQGAGRLADAEAAYRGVLAIDSQNFDALHLLGVVHAQRGQPADAERLIAAALAIEDDARARNNYGMALLELNRAPEALDQFDKAAALEPKLPSAQQNRATALRALGRLDDALVAVDSALALKSDFVEAIANRAAILQDLGRYVDALEMANRAASLAPQTAIVYVKRALLLSAMGHPREALADYERALKIKPDYWAAQCGRAAALLALGKPEEALSVYDHVIAAAPLMPEAHAGKGVVFLRMQCPAEAIAAFDASLRAKPDYTPALNNKGTALHMLKRLDEALACFDAILAMHPDNADAANNRAVVLKDLGRTEEALAMLDGLMPGQAGSPTLHHNRGLILQSLKRLDEAVQSYGIAIALFPNFAQAFSDRAAAFVDLERWNEATASAGRAIALDPNNADAHYNHGTALQHLNRWDDALADFDEALRLKPSYAAAQNNRAVVLQLLKRPEEARDAFDAAVALNPTYSEAACAAFTISNQICDWRDIDTRRADILKRTRAGEVITPFAVFAAADDPQLHRMSAEGFARDRAEPQPPLGASPGRKPHARLRIGYVSADFYDHATAQLTAEMFESHDRSRFEIYAISLTDTDNSTLRKRLEAAIEHFVEGGTLSDFALAQKIAELEIDILVDLKGYTNNCRPRIFSLRPAPVSVAYLGYPGTTGSPNIDYLIADSYVIPAESRAFYTEKVVTLPGCYQVNDSKKAIGKTPSRASLGLPERSSDGGGFVFCSFNGSYKITPEMLDAWVRILKAVPDSVLWLYADSETAKANLIREADVRGIGAGRIVFADFAELPEHLARMPAADLFLDTFPICAHTTASDSLWAGLPLLTVEGKSFVGRVAGSLLTTIGVPELIAKDFADYEAKAIAFARDLKKLTALRERIAKGRTDSSLFDGAAFARHIEDAYATMWDAHALGVAPKDFVVRDSSKKTLH